MKKLYLFILLILPATLVFTAVSLRYSQGPYWLSSYVDPEYLYVLSSLSLAESGQTVSPGHPGTTLQILMAAAMKISYALEVSEKDSLEFAVLKHPEFYLTLTNNILIMLNTLMIFFIGLTAYKLTKNIWLSLLLQFTPFIYNNVLIDGLPRVSPEPLLLFASMLFLLILLGMAFNENLSKSIHWYTVALALVSGFGMATKLTFVSLLIIPLFALPKLRNNIVFLFLTGFSFLLFVWPIISQYESLIQWYHRIFTHGGYYGEGSQDIIYLNSYFRDIAGLFLGNPLFLLIWLFSVVFIIGYLIVGKATGNKFWQDTSFRIIAGMTAAQLIAVLMVAKQPAGWYLIPALILSGLMLFLILKYLQDLKYFSIKRVILFTGLFIFSMSILRIIDIKNVLVHNLQIKKESFAVYTKMESGYKDYLKIYHFFLSSHMTSSAPVCALAFGNYFVNEGRYSESLQKIYGDVYYYNSLNQKFYIWTKEFSIEDLVLQGRGRKIVFQFPSIHEYGDQITCRSGSVLHLQDIFGGEIGTIYVPQGITLMKGENKVPEKSFLPYPGFSK